MKKTLLFLAFGAFVAFNVTGQNSKTPAKPSKSLQNVAVPMTKKAYTGQEKEVLDRMKKTYKSSGVANSLNGQTVGETTYDLQSNASIQNRVVQHPGNNISVAFTYSNTLDLAASDRGTGYVYRGATGWGAQPNARIESERVGWPSLYRTGSGGEGIIAHNTVQGVLTQNTRSSAGSGAWTETLQMTNPATDLIWNRAAVGGPNNNTVHLIAVTAPVANDGSLYQGLDGALVYFRSTDGGATWSTTFSILPGMTSSDFPGFDGDSYAIMAKGNTVAFAVFNDFNESFIMKSTDNGLTWTKTVFWETGLSNYDPGATGSISDINNDGVADTLETTDGSGAIIIDNNGDVHVWFGLMRQLDDDPAADAAGSFFPATDGLMYWNENLNDEPFVIASAPDRDGNGTIDIFGNGIDGIATYFLSLTSMPHAGIDANGTIYVTYSTHIEDLNNGAQNYRHVYMKKSTDGGCTWTEGVDITPANNFAECVFATMDPNVTDSVRLIFQEDNIPGLAVRGEEHAFTNNLIVYKAVAAADIPNTPEVCHTNIAVDGQPAFCQGDSLLLEATSCGSAFSWNTGETSQSIFAKSYQTYTVDITTACGVITEEVSIAAPSGTLPSFSINSTEVEICPGDPASLNVPGISVGSAGGYVWSTGETTPTITVTTPGTYDVTITNCQGTGNASITINQPSTVNAVINGDTEFCPGGTVDLSVNEVTGGAYLWSTGSTAPTTTVNAAGTYTVTVTNCAGTASSSITVVENNTADISLQATGDVVQTGNEITFCEGTNLTLTGIGGENWIWFKDNVQIPGANTQSIGIQNVDQSGSYYVEAANECGIRGNSDTVNVTVNPAPEVPSLSVSGNQVTATSNGAASYVWFLNGNQSSQTGSTYNIPNGFSNPQITAVAVSDAGCESAVSSAVTSTRELVAENGFNMYPNPAKGLVNFEFESNAVNAVISIYNTIGELVHTELVTDNRSTLSLETFNSGLYFVEVKANESSATYKLIVK